MTLFAVTVRDVGDDGPGDIWDIDDLILDEPGRRAGIIAALADLRDNIKRGDWTSPVVACPDTDQPFEIIPIRPEDVREHIDATLAG